MNRPWSRDALRFAMVTGWTTAAAVGGLSLSPMFATHALFVVWIAAVLTFTVADRRRP